jgi:uncharacterized protein (TIRG00374 family)
MKTYMRLKSFAINILKFVLSAGLIYWLIASGKITFQPFIMLLEKSWLIPLTLFSTFVVIVINNYRWVLLLHGQKIKTGLWRSFQLTLIGLFFNLVMPGSVGGDVLKAYYISKDHPSLKTKTVTSILIDRILGLYAICLLAFFSIFFEWNMIQNSPHLKSLSFFIFALVLGFTFFFALGFSRRVRKHKIIVKTLTKIPGGKIIEKVYDAVHAFREGKKEFLIGILLSIISQSQMYYFLYFTIREIHFDTTLSACFFVLPVGFMATALPISPAGIGVGQVVFYKLFYWYHGIESALGPTLITINQLAFAFWGLVGAIFYLFYKAKHERT